MSSVAIDRAAVVANAKQIITNAIGLLREAGMSGDEIAAVVFACSLASSSKSSSASVSVAGSVTSDAPVETKKRAGRPKKEKDPDAPKKEGNPKFLEAIARAKKWYEDEYMPNWETRKDEWRELYNRIPVKKDAKRERPAFPEDKPVSIQLAQSIYKLMNAPSEEEVAAAKAAKKVASKAKKADAPVPAAAAATAEKPDSSDDVEFFPLELDGQNYIFDDLKRTWRLNDDGTKGDWAGIYDPVNNTLDDTVEEPIA